MAIGKKTGGRQKGSVNKRTEGKRVLIRQQTGEGVTPLEVLLGSMRKAWEKGIEHENYGNHSEAEACRKTACAHAVDAAPYLHPKLSTISHQGDEDNPLRTVTRIELIGYSDGDSAD